MRALRLCEALRAAGINVWYDEWEILVGHSILDSIYDGIKSCDYLAVLLTKQSVESHWVKHELDFAKQQELERHKVKILPLLYEKCELPDTLAGKRYADFTDFDKGFSQLLAGLAPNRSHDRPISRANSLTDSEVEKLFDDLESKSHDRALEAARRLSEFRDPRAKRLLLGKLSGNAYERHVAVVGLSQYSSPEVLPHILCVLPTDFLAYTAVCEQETGSMVLDTIRTALRSLPTYDSELAILYLWGVLVVSYSSKPEITSQLRDLLKAECHLAFSQIEPRVLASVSVKLFGYANTSRGLEALMAVLPRDMKKPLRKLMREVQQQKIVGMILPVAPDLYDRFRLSGVEEGEYFSFTRSEFDALAEAYKRLTEAASPNAPADLRVLGSVLFAAEQVYGLVPGSPLTEQDSRILAKLQLFLRLYERERSCVTESELSAVLQKREKADSESIMRIVSDLFEFERTLFPRAAVEFMMSQEEKWLK